MIQTPWGPAQTPMAVLPYFYCPKCDIDVNLGDCSHNRQDFTPPIWIKKFALWKKGKFEVEGVLLEKFEWLRGHAVVFSDGFESNNYTAWTSTAPGAGGTLATASDQAREGTYSSKMAATQVDSYGTCSKTLANTARLYVRIYFRIDTLLSGNWKYVARLITINSSAGGASTIAWDYWTNGSGVGGWRKARWYPSYVQSAVDTSYSPSVNTWHAIEGTMLIHATTGEYKFWQDGNELTGLTETGLDTSAAANLNGIEAQNRWTTAHSATTWNLWIDSVVVDDASYIGPIAAGWTHKILGIANANISKINGVAKASIAKVNGV